LLQFGGPKAQSCLNLASAAVAFLEVYLDYQIGLPLLEYVEYTIFGYYNNLGV
jgi:hypothetical protein